MYKRIFLLLVSVVILIVFLLNQNRNKQIFDANKQTNYIDYNIKYFKEVSLNNKDRYIKYFQDRFVSIDENQLYIGNNKNEVDNGYYDIYMKVGNNEIVFVINKLFKDFDKNEICDDDYLYCIIQLFIDMFNLQIDKSEVFNLIKENYEKLRDIDRNTVESVDKTVEKAHIKYEISVKNNMLVIKLGDK